jgi:hypothetical protein
MADLRAIIVSTALVLCCFLPVHASAQESTRPTVAAINLQNLRWIVGDWQSSQGRQTIDEHWSLAGDSLLGISRSIEESRSKTFELLLIEKQDNDYLLRLRFFGPAIEKATRGKDQPLRLKVVQADTEKLLCEGIDAETGTTVTYTKLSPNSMTAQIRKIRDSAVVWQEDYVFKRMPQ